MRQNYQCTGVHLLTWQFVLCDGWCDWFLTLRKYPYLTPCKCSHSGHFGGGGNLENLSLAAKEQKFLFVTLPAINFGCSKTPFSLRVQFSKTVVPIHAAWKDIWTSPTRHTVAPQETATPCRILGIWSVPNTYVRFRFSKNLKCTLNKRKMPNHTKVWGPKSVWKHFFSQKTLNHRREIWCGLHTLQQQHALRAKTSRQEERSWIFSLCPKMSLYIDVCTNGATLKKDSKVNRSASWPKRKWCTGSREEISRKPQCWPVRPLYGIPRDQTTMVW